MSVAAPLSPIDKINRRTRKARDVATLRICAIVIAVASIGFCGMAQADSGQPDFYAGKTITLIVGSAAGSGYDTYGRLFARFWPEHIPGHPNIVVENMVGVSGLRAAYYISKAAGADGTIVALATGTLPVAPLMTPSAAQFDVNRFSWIGNATKDTYISYLWHNAPAKSYEDAKTMDVVLGGISAGSPSVNLANISNALFKTRFKIISGYHSPGEMNLAMQRGEIQGTFVNTYSALKSQEPKWLEDGEIKVILQQGFQKNPNFPDVPMFIDQAKTDFQRQVLEFVLSPQETAKPFFGPPQMPADRLAILRRGFDATLEDAAFQTAANQAGVEIVAPMTGEELTDFVRRVSGTPQAAVEFVNSTISNTSMAR